MRTDSWSGDSSARLEIALGGLGGFIGKSSAGFVIVSLALAGYGLARLIQATPAGMGLGSDSYYYHTAAENLANGQGFGRLNGRGDLVPTTHFPPFYPVTMAGLQILGVVKLESTRWVNLASFTALVLVAATVVRREMQSNYPAYVAAALLASSRVVFDVSVWAMSEPLYLALGLGGLLLLSLYSERGSRWLLLSAAVLVGLGYLTRYVGISLVATGLAVILLMRGTWRRRLVDGALLVSVSILPVIAWWARNASLTGNFANRRIIWHPITLDHFRALTLHVVEWFVPAEFIQGGIYAAGFLALLVAVFSAIVLRIQAADRLTLRFRRGGMPLLLVLYSALYMLALAASLSLFDPFTPVGNRILSPVHISIMLLAVILAWDVWTRQGNLVRGLIAAGFAFIILWNGLAQARLAESYGTYGLGNAAPSIAESQTVAAVRELPDVPIVTNGISRLYFWADRNSFAIPWLIDLETGERDPDYEDILQIMRGRLCDEGGYLILFYPENLVPQQAPLGDLIAGLTQYGDYQDGEIYFCRDS